MSKWCLHIGLAWQAAAEAARVAAERRGAEAAQRQAHRQELRKQEEAQALTNLRAFKDSIKAVVSRVSLSHCCSNHSPVCLLRLFGGAGMQFQIFSYTCMIALTGWYIFLVVCCLSAVSREGFLTRNTGT